MCIMNAISYLNGDTEITDMPSCTHLVLAKVAQVLNDQICTHREGNTLCVECSTIMWGYEPLLRGTEPPADELQAQRLSVHLAITAASAVLPIFEGEHPTDDRPRKAIETAQKWLDEPTEENAASANAAYAAASANAAAYAAASANAAYAAASANAAYAAASANAAYAASATAHVRQLLDHLIDAYYEFMGREKPSVPQDWQETRKLLEWAGAMS
jgi:hypothetical protein